MRRSLVFCLATLVFCLLPFGFCFRPSASSQTPLDSKNDGGVVPAVVQLLAIGPGTGEKNRECSATGFLVNAEGYILTNAHVVEDAQRCVAKTPGAKILAKLAQPESRTATAVSCDVVGVDDLHDLAVMKTERPPPATTAGGPGAFALLDPREVAEGTAVVVTGHPAFTWKPVTQSGKVLRRGALRLSEESTETSDVLVLDIPLRRGNSGSPVYLDAGGGVVGIVERQDALRPSQTVAVPVRYAIELLNRHGVKWYPSQN